MAEERPPLLLLPLECERVWVLAPEEVEHSGVVVQHIHRVLVVAPNGQVGMAADGALGGRNVSCHQLQQR